MAEVRTIRADGRFGKVVPVGKVFAGHVVTGANPILATLDGVIAEMADVRLVRRMEPEVGLGLCTPERS